MAAKTKSDLAELLRLVEERAPRLIAAGVTSVSVEGLSLTLASSVPTDPKDLPKADPVVRGHIDPMRDPSTYPGGRVPGFTREDEI